MVNRVKLDRFRRIPNGSHDNIKSKRNAVWLHTVFTRAPGRFTAGTRHRAEKNDTRKNIMWRLQNSHFPDNTL